ncbi:metal ABC transporter ATP-binding protein [Psychrobacter sp. AOP22-C1-22]|uniref:metal ABC transporter ATP-binding protein n=1 Tax=unclassified Psychrobacter TaxID=196806 RepID=UPI001CE3D009|nr:MULTISPECIES: metal ABC transporter ATP-binding protein [unclassified Psychrobacter]MDN5801055.1 metal ABC transporter ATP-binding protein [Psychrobacter sp.]MDN5891217.1 metal ABC transporter ATP-binding protein [Psychrobacter sp.]
MSLSTLPFNQPSASVITGNSINSVSKLLSLNNVSFDINQQRLLSNINIDIAINETVSLIGPNGAGKSTLVKLILGLIEPTDGQITPHQKLQLGYVPQRFAVPPILPLRVRDLLAQADKKRLTAEQRQFIFDNLSLTHLLSRQMLHLSGGETQRVLLARALLEKPNLLILDEPMQGLDPDTEVWLYQFIDELPEFLRCAMLVVSHDLHWVMKGSRRVICLNKHICCEGQPSELAISSEFQKLFGHHYEQPYVHQPHACEHHAPSELEL